MTATVGDLKKFIANLPNDMPLAYRDWYHVYLADDVEYCVGVGQVSDTDPTVVLFTHHHE